MPHSEFKSCIDACNDCALACEHCASACLTESDVKAMARCIALDTDCAAICHLAAAYMGRGSELAQSICQSCAEVCERCGEECAKHPMDHCQACAEACRRCADACRAMSGGARPESRQSSAGANAHH
jgi:hypothetical protein